LAPNTPGSTRARSALFAIIVLLCGGCAPHVEPQTPRGAEGSLPPLAEGDLDEDGLADEEEASLASRFAPIVILDRRDAHRPASIPWLLRAGARGGPSGTLRIPKSARRGSSDPREWTAYVHVYPRADGGINLQYWFFYPYNDGPLFFDHDADWEHVTVRLDADRAPVGAYLARHGNDHPGPFWRWAHLRRSGDHPVVLSALGSHATYANGSDVAWYDRASSCTKLVGCPDPIWRTWEGGLPNLGERTRPLVLSKMMEYAGRWGSSHWLPGTSAPFGPLQHRGTCADGFASCVRGVLRSNRSYAHARIDPG
jgi:hypothetical protein